MITIPASRAEAIATGKSTYAATVLCTGGHTPCIRYVHNKACTACENEKRNARYASAPERERTRRAAWKKANPESVAAEHARYRAANKDAIKETQKAKQERMRPKREEARKLKAKAREAAAKARETAEKANRSARAAERYAVRMLVEHDPSLGREFNGLTLRGRLKRGARRAARFGALCNLSIQDVIEIGNFQNWACAHCGSSNSLRLDHIKPLSRGGHHTQGNVQWLCELHNKDKRDQLEGDYRRLRGIPCCTPWDVL